MRSVDEVIESGEYFEQAQEWYASKYLAPYMQRTYQLMISATISIFMVIIAHLAFRDDSIARLYPFPLFIEDSANEVMRIKYIGRPNSSVDDAITKYLVQQYVMRRESYAPKQLDEESVTMDLRYVRNSSSWQVFNDYKQYISTENFNSPFVRYKFHTTRIINIKSVLLIPTLGQYQKARIKYEAVEQEVEASRNKNWVAEIEFETDEAQDLIHNKSDVVGFKVVKYTTYEG
jgi:type IV secretory pathway component VirB8